ncbi:MAG: hypothetical protein ACRDXF_10030 [Acidimicrobiia bacterium]
MSRQRQKTQLELNESGGSTAAEDARPVASISPHPVVSRLAGVAMIMSILFATLGNAPVVQDFFDQTITEELRLQYLLDAAEEWDRANTMWALIGVMTIIGFLLWAVAIRLGRADRTSRLLATLGAISAVVGSLSWIAVCVWRMSAPPVDVAAGPGSVFLAAWALFVGLAVGLVGWLLRRANMGARSWVTIVVAALFIPIGYILPVAVIFPVTLTGLIILFTRSSRWESSVRVTASEVAP